jgi:hypothetical protein
VPQFWYGFRTNNDKRNIMALQHSMATLSMVLEKLRLKNQANEFRISGEGFTADNGKTYQPEQLKIIRTYRFEGDSNPSDSSILYLIEANDGLIGYSIDAYGAYSNHEDDGYDDFIKRIPMEERDEQLIFG